MLKKLLGIKSVAVKFFTAFKLLPLSGYKVDDG